MFLGGDSAPRTWQYAPRTKTWTRIRAGGQPPEFPIDHGQVGSDGKHMYVLGGFGGDDVPAGAGLTPRGAMWIVPGRQG